MHYERIKERLGKVFGTSVLLRKFFYRLLNILLLRTWHIHKEIKNFRRKYKHVENISILDAGSGFGQYTYYLAKKNPNWQIESIDINDSEIKACNDFFEKAGLKNISCKVADLTNFSNPEKYDMILSVDVMEHIENDQAVFYNFFESLKKNGMLIISTPSDIGGSDVTNDKKESFIDEHVRDGYSKNDIFLKLKKVGFKNLDIYYTYGKYGKLSWRLSMKYPLFLIKHKWMLPVLFFYYIIVMPFCLLLNFADTRINNKKGTGLIVKAYKPINN